MAVAVAEISRLVIAATINCDTGIIGDGHARDGIRGCSGEPDPVVTDLLLF